MGLKFGTDSGFCVLGATWPEHVELFSEEFQRLGVKCSSFFEMERLTPRWSQVLTYTVRSETETLKRSWRSMASVLLALWRVPYSGATMEADIEFATVILALTFAMVFIVSV